MGRTPGHGFLGFGWDLASLENMQPKKRPGTQKLEKLYNGNTRVLSEGRRRVFGLYCLAATSGATISCSAEMRDWVKAYSRRHGLLSYDNALRPHEGRFGRSRAAAPQPPRDAEQPGKKTEAGAADIVGLVRGARRDPHLLDRFW